MNFAENLKKTFNSICDSLFSDLETNEELLLNLHGEDSFFVRFNNNLVRQNTHVEQISVSMKLQKNRRTATIDFSITGQAEEDLQRAQQWLSFARKECDLLPEDPYQVPLANNGVSDTSFAGALLKDEDVIDAIIQPAKGSDLAGLYSGGPLISANRNSKGQSHWFATENFFLDYSLYNGDKAVKGVYAGTEWNQKALEEKIQNSRNQLSLMDRPKKLLSPGKYRVYLAPAAVAEISTMFQWGAFSYSNYKQGGSGFQRLADGEKSLSPLFSLRENFKLGLAPSFNELGEVSAESFSLLEKGQLQTLLISSRSAKEYGVPSNQAASYESPRAMEILPGVLNEKDILRELGTGLYLSNLHYINWSDRLNARITGMTRYACFWVENGEITSPIADMRFDESLYDCLGANLLAVTSFQDIEPNVMTYDSRTFGGSLFPGMLIKDFTFTL